MQFQNRKRGNAVLLAAGIGLILLESNLFAFCCCNGMIHNYTKSIDDFFRSIVKNETDSFNKVVNYFKELEEDTKVRTGSNFKSSQYYQPLQTMLDVQKELKSFYDVNYRLDYALNFYKIEHSETNYNFRNILEADSAFSELIDRDDTSILNGELRQELTKEAQKKQGVDLGELR